MDILDVAGAGLSIHGQSGARTMSPAVKLAIYQATGMVSVQLGVSIEDALALLRARAFAETRPIGELAADVTERRFRFAP